MALIDQSEFDAHLAGMTDALADGDFSTCLQQDVRPLLLQSTRDTFNSQADAQGNAWPERKVAGDGHPLLWESGSLLKAAAGEGAGHVSDVGQQSLEIGVDKSVEEGGIPGAAVHQFGWPEKNIKARPYIETRDEYLDEAAEVIADAGLRILEGLH
jgi:phage gpG-like protein